MNFFTALVFALLSHKIVRHAKKRGIAYSFLFVHPNGNQLAEIGELLTAGRIRPPNDKVFPFKQAKEALAYLEKGRAKGKVRSGALPCFPQLSLQARLHLKFDFLGAVSLRHSECPKASPVGYAKS